MKDYKAGTVSRKEIRCSLSLSGLTSVDPRERD
jgi:hypothetical protein